MAPRKGKGRQAVRNSGGGFPAWGWAVIGILVGVGLMVAFNRHALLPITAQLGPQPNPQATAERASEPGVADTSAAAADTDKPKKPQYDFYSALTEKDVRIPDAEISAQARAEQQQQQQQNQQQQAAQAQAAQTAAATRPPPPARNLPAAVSQTITAAPAATPPAAAAAAGGGYLLQVGAFPSAAAADTLKAKLAMLGFVANVRQDNIGGVAVNRVRLGPYHSASDLESVKQRLSSNGIPAIALKEGR